MRIICHLTKYVDSLIVSKMNFGTTMHKIDIYILVLHFVCVNMANGFEKTQIYVTNMQGRVYEKLFQYPSINFKGLNTILVTFYLYCVH